MSKYETYKTKKGTELPLISLKGKPYMQVAQRLVWFTEEVPSYLVKTEFPLLTVDETICHVTVQLLDANGRVTKEAQATKREDKKGFSDHTEKAETGALGRALALLGFGTQFAVADLDEGDRLADSPITVVPKTGISQATLKADDVVKAIPTSKSVEIKAEAPKPAGKFVRPKPAATKSTTDYLDDI